MFKKYTLCLILLLQFAFSSGKYPSPLPTPSAEVLKVSTGKCNTNCLRSLLKGGQVFSFIANVDKDNQNKEIINALNMFLDTLEIAEIPYVRTTQKPFFNLALLFPRRSIGRYSSTTTNVILSYLLMQKGQFNFESFDSKTESLEDLEETLVQIASKGYRQVIAVVTQEGALNINLLNPSLAVFIPSVHQSQIGNVPLAKEVVFGGISYAEQLERLSTLSQNSSVASFYDDSLIGKQMQIYTEIFNPNIIYSKSFNLKQNPDFQKEIKSVKGILQESCIFLNTPVTNSSVILSQLTFNDIVPKGLYSTQINYSPSLLSITQERDRHNMFVANSIMPIDDYFIESAKLLDADLEYNWINYATAYGVEYFYKKNVPGAKLYFKETIKAQQVQYNIEILKPTNTRFVPIQEM